MKTLIKIMVLPIFLIIMGFYKYNSAKIYDQLLNEKEVNAILFMLEEEKLAFDVYTKMDEKWGTRQFNHIKDSELAHMEALEELLKKNEIKYQLLEQGQFQNQKLQDLYNNLIAQGNRSETEALKVGAKIEDVDLYDLIRLKKDTQNKELMNVYQFLECGSRNHLRAFTRGLNKFDETYHPEFISQKDYEIILNHEQEKCGQMFYK